MKNTIFTFFFLFVALMSIKAQSNFRPGYIITNEKDTISGLIDFRTHEMNAQVCKFKLSNMDEVKEYYPGDIYGYRFTDDGKYYVSKDIEIEGKQEKVFLEYLIQGIISLYFYPGDESDYYFFQDESGILRPVTKRDREVWDDETGKWYIAEDNRYKSAISYIFKDSKSVSKAVYNTPFLQNRLIDLTKRYHDEMCSTGEECIQFETKPDNYTQIKVSVYTGMQILTYKLNSQFLENTPKFNLIPEINSLLPEIGAQLDFSTPRRNKFISLVIDVSLAKFTEKQEKISEPQYAKLEVDGVVVSGKLGVKYTYHQGLFRPLIEGGFSINRLYVSTKYTYNDGPYVKDVVADDFLEHPAMIGFYVGTGLDYQLKKNNALLFRIAYNNSIRMQGAILNKSNPKDKMTSWEVKLGYTF